MSNSSKDGFNGMHCIRQNLINDGLSKESIDIIMFSWRSNTSKKYNTYIKQWIEFCEKSNRDFQNAAIQDGLDFLKNLFEHKKNYSTISCTRSALSLFMNTGNNVEFGKQLTVQKYIRGIFHLRPNLLKYTFTWDVRKLLDYYRSQLNNTELDLKALTFKTTTPTDTTLMSKSSDSLFIISKEDKIQKKGIKYK